MDGYEGIFEKKVLSSRVQPGQTQPISSPVNGDEATLLDRFIRKLNPPLDSLVKNANPLSVLDVVAKAQRFDKAFLVSSPPMPKTLLKDGKRYNGQKGATSSPKHNKNNRGSSQNTGKMEPPTNRSFSQPYLSFEDRTRLRKEQRCFNCCQEIGHLAHDCPRPCQNFVQTPPRQ